MKNAVPLTFKESAEYYFLSQASLQECSYCQVLCHLV